LDKQELLHWVEMHDREYSFGIQKEKEIGDRLRLTKELIKSDLNEIIEWKFEGRRLEGRKRLELNRVANIDEQILKKVSNFVFNLDTNQDIYRIKLLCVFNGVGPAVASTILTFFDPKNYGVFDLHVWQEIFHEKLSQYSFLNYLKLLSKLRKIAEDYGLQVRTVEKAYFKKNYDRK